MNDKQKLALKELADVMEKHGITMDSNDTFWLNAQGAEIIYSDYDTIDAEYIREALKE